LKLSEPHQIEWQWVRGHKGHKENERCDELARKAIRKCAQHATRGGENHGLAVAASFRVYDL
jgi:ribonuclease HI